MKQNIIHMLIFLLTVPSMYIVQSNNIYSLQHIYILICIFYSRLFGKLVFSRGLNSIVWVHVQVFKHRPCNV